MGELANLAVEVITNLYSIPAEKARDMYFSTVGIPFEAQLRLLFPGNDKNVIANAIYKKEHFNLSPTFPLSVKVRELFKELDKAGIEKALVTSTDWIILRDQLPQVNSLGFDSMSGYCENNTKLVQIRNAMRILDSDSQYTLYVGDTVFDESCAVACKINFVMVTPQTLYDNVMYAIEANELRPKVLPR